jgi:hypothetical protein
MNRNEAISTLINNSSLRDLDLGVRNVRRSVDEVDDLVWWTCDVFDPYADEGADLVGHAQFHEHWPEVEIAWC